MDLDDLIIDNPWNPKLESQRAANDSKRKTVKTQAILLPSVNNFKIRLATINDDGTIELQGSVPIHPRRMSNGTSRVREVTDAYGDIVLNPDDPIDPNDIADPVQIWIPESVNDTVGIEQDSGGDILQTTFDLNNNNGNRFGNIFRPSILPNSHNHILPTIPNIPLVRPGLLNPSQIIPNRGFQNSGFFQRTSPESVTYRPNTDEHLEDEQLGAPQPTLFNRPRGFSGFQSGILPQSGFQFPSSQQFQQSGLSVIQQPVLVPSQIIPQSTFSGNSGFSSFLRADNQAREEKQHSSANTNSEDSDGTQERDAAATFGRPNGLFNNRPGVFSQNSFLRPGVSVIQRPVVVPGSLMSQTGFPIAGRGIFRTNPNADENNSSKIENYSEEFVMQPAKLNKPDGVSGMLPPIPFLNRTVISQYGKSLPTDLALLRSSSEGLPNATAESNATTAETYNNDSRSADPHHHHLHTYTVIHHHGQHLRPIQHSILPSGFQISQNMQFTLPYNNVPSSFHASLSPQHHPVYNQPQPIIPLDVRGGPVVPGASATTQFANVHGTSNTVHQNQQVAHAGDAITNSGQIANIQGTTNGINQAQTSRHNVESSPSPLTEGEFQSVNVQKDINNVDGTQVPNNKLQSAHLENTEILQKPYLIDVPKRRLADESRTAGKRSIRTKEGNIDAAKQKRRKITKRSLPVVRLIADPNAKLDVPKTIENIGTVTKKSFQDKHKPMYHFNNMVGSIRDLVMSTIKIPPQGVVIPSQYKIMDVNDVQDVIDEPQLGKKSEMTRSINTELLDQEDKENLKQEPDTDPFHVVDTFQRIGTALRDSIKSGQNTLVHVGDLAHSARKVVHTSRHAAPKVILPYARAPAVERERDNKPHHLASADSVTLIAPKVLDIKDESEAHSGILQAHNRRDFVNVGQIMDALGVSNPNEENVGMEKIVLHKKPRKHPISITSTDRGGAPSLESRLADVDFQRFPVMKPKENLLGGSAPKEHDLRHFVTKMKNEFDTLVKAKLEDEKKNRQLKKNKKKIEKHIEKLQSSQQTVGSAKSEDPLEKTKRRLEILKSAHDDLLDTIKSAKTKVSNTLKSSKDDDDNIVGITHINLPSNFPSDEKPTAKLKSDQDDSDSWEKQANSFLGNLFDGKQQTFGVDDVILGAPAPPDPHALNLRPELLRPFMGRATKLDIKKFLKANGDVVEDDEIVGGPQEDFQSNDIVSENIKNAQKILGAVNPLMFEKMFNETLQSNNLSSMTPYELFTNHNEPKEQQPLKADPPMFEINSNETLSSSNNLTSETPHELSAKSKELEQPQEHTDSVGTSMKLTKVMLKPFMGRKHDKPNSETIEIYPVEEIVPTEEIY